MRDFLFSVLFFLSATTLPFFAKAETSSQNLTDTLTLGSSGSQVILLQKILNQDPDTQVANTGSGSPGNETDRFGTLTRSAVIRFQNKYANEVLIPTGLIQGNGRVGAFTRSKLNALGVKGVKSVTTQPAPTSVTYVPPPTPLPEDFLVKESEKTDIYAGDALLNNAQEKILEMIHAAVSSGNASSLTTSLVASSSLPPVGIKTISSQQALPGTKIFISGVGISSNSVVYFGSNRIVRSPQVDASGNISFAVPPIAPGLYDIAIKTGTTISSTLPFVVVDPRNPPVLIQGVSPTTVKYGDTLTITGSGFTPKNNIVITKYQKFTDVASSDGKTLVVVFTPKTFQEASLVGNGERDLTVSISVVNDNGFSNKKTFVIKI
jgi:peptidoglycan hydrolase-like protein with peptidoglycan-binding domain